MRGKVLAIVLALAGTGAVTVSGTYAAFSRTTGNQGNRLDAGSVTVSDGHPAATPISITNLRPGTTVSNCVAVTYTGSLPADLRQYATTSGALVPYVQIKVTRGNGLSAAWPSCTGFTADATNYIGQGAGVIYNGALSSIPTSAAAATRDPTNAAPETWTNPETHAYRYDISLTNTPAAQGLSGSTTITFRAENL